MISSKKFFNLYGLSLAIVTFGAILLVSPIAFAALQSPANSGNSSNASDRVSSSDKKPASKLTDRVTEYKAKQSVKLATAEETRLKGVCKAAQNKVKALVASSNSANTDRVKHYGDIAKQLQTIISRLKDAGVTSTELNDAQSKLKELIGKYNDDYEVFKTSLADLSELDCVTDPAAFKAALLTARQTRPNLQQDAANIRSHVAIVKQALMMARIQLTVNNPASSTDSDNADQSTDNSNTSNSSNAQGGTR